MVGKLKPGKEQIETDVQNKRKREREIEKVDVADGRNSKKTEKKGEMQRMNGYDADLSTVSKHTSK